MATVEPPPSLPSSTASPAPPSSGRRALSVKALSESPDLKCIPSDYAYFNDSNDFAFSDHHQVSIPVIDLSLLESGSPDQRSKIIHELGKACQDWGFFMVVNHGIPEAMLKKMLDVIKEFFEMPEEEKREWETKHVLDPIRSGTSFNAAKDQVFFWRDFIKVFVHPQFHSPHKPHNFSEFLLEYSKRTRQVARKLLEGISESLGLVEGHIGKEMQWDSGFQIFIANLYPPCPQPEVAMGMPPHSDHGLLTLLLQNEVGGLQIQHKGNWVNVDALPNSFLVNIGDHLEVFSNGKYKSVLHRAVVNNKKTRISIAMANGPCLDAMVRPASKLLENDGTVPKYTAMKYRDYLELQQSNKLDGKSCLDRVKI